MARVHHLKTQQPHFAAVANGSKPFEVRWDDRDFQVGDQLVLQEYHPDREPPYTGHELMREVSHVLLGEEVGLPAGFVIMSLAPGGHYLATIIEACAQAAEATQRKGLWADILKRAGANVRALKVAS